MGRVSGQCPDFLTIEGRHEGRFLRSVQRREPRRDLGAALKAFSFALNVAQLSEDRISAIYFALVTTAPRHGKSLLCVQLFASWFLGKHPESVIIATHGEELAATFGRSIRTIISGGIHGTIFPESRLAPDLSAMHRFGTTRGGSLVV